MKTFKKFSAIILTIALLFVFTACNNTNQESPKTSEATQTAVQTGTDPLWENAKYKEDTELGEGEKTFTVIVEAGSFSIKFTVHSNEEMLGTALINLGIIKGSDGPYGIMVEKVNGIQAIYDKDKAYWGLSINGEYAMSGADTTPINDGSVYTWTYTKG